MFINPMAPDALTFSRKLFGCMPDGADDEAFALAPSFAVITGQWPQISLQSAGDHAFITAAEVPSGFALLLMQDNQFLHQGLILGPPPTSRPRVQRTSTGS
jgi:hypothetical protein